MKGTAFLSKANKYFNLSFDRLQKIATALRSEGLYPDGRSKDHVTITQAAHLLRLLAISPNPFTEDLQNVISQHDKLVTSTNEYFFILDLAEILSESGLCLPTVWNINLTHHVSISLDRPFALIAFQQTEKGTDFPEGTEISYIKTGERLYGESQPRSHERFAILKRTMLWELGTALQQTGLDMATDDQGEREQILNKINALK